GSRIEISPERYEFVGGEPLTVSVTVAAPADVGLDPGTVTLTAPEGWQTGSEQSLPALAAGDSHEVSFELTAGAGLAAGETARITVVVTSGSETGSNSAPVRVGGALESTIAPLEEIGEFRDWTRALDIKHLDALVPELFAVGQGRTRTLEIITRNLSSRERGGSVEIMVPEGFEISPARLEIAAVGPSEEVSHTVEVTSTDTSLPAANRSEDEGAWPVTIRADSEGSASE